MLFLALHLDTDDYYCSEKVLGVFDTRAGAYEKLVREGSLSSGNWRIRQVALNGTPADDEHDEVIEVPRLVWVSRKPEGAPGYLDVQAFNDLFKSVYSDSVADLVPDASVLLKPFR